MFEVGKEVICIKSHSQGIVKKGQKFMLLGIQQKACGCTGNVMLDIGKRSDEMYCATRVKCSECNGIAAFSTDRIQWLNANSFAPIDNTLSDTTSDELIEKLEYQTAEQA